jgi:hypothetical protein
MATAEIQCCGQWTPYPKPGQDTWCPGCGTVFTVPEPAAVLGLTLDTIEAKTRPGPDADIALLRATLAEIGRLTRCASGLAAIISPARNVTGT